MSVLEQYVVKLDNGRTSALMVHHMHSSDEFRAVSDHYFMLLSYYALSHSQEEKVKWSKQIINANRVMYSMIERSRELFDKYGLEVLDALKSERTGLIKDYRNNRDALYHQNKIIKGSSI